MCTHSKFWLALVVASYPWNWCSAQGSNQWQANGFGDQYLISAPPLFPVPPRSITVGTTANPLSSLVVHGDQMTPPTGEVFRTYANNLDTYWRLFRSGGNIGSIYSLNTDEHFHINAHADDIRLYSSNIGRARLNQTMSVPLINGYGPITVSGFFGVGEFSGLYQQASAKLH